MTKNKSEFTLTENDIRRLLGEFDGQPDSQKIASLKKEAEDKEEDDKNRNAVETAADSINYFVDETDSFNNDKIDSEKDAKIEHLIAENHELRNLIADLINGSDGSVDYTFDFGSFLS